MYYCMYFSLEWIISKALACVGVWMDTFSHMQLILGPNFTRTLVQYAVNIYVDISLDHLEPSALGKIIHAMSRLPLRFRFPA